jgi:hypothetical protein
MSCTNCNPCAACGDDDYQRHDRSFEAGVAFAFGIMGMVEAIRTRHLEHTNLWCPRCVGLELGHHPECNWAPDSPSLPTEDK